MPQSRGDLQRAVLHYTDFERVHRHKTQSNADANTSKKMIWLSG
jgi:hypothetical protein